MGLQRQQLEERQEVKWGAHQWGEPVLTWYKSSRARAPEVRHQHFYGPPSPGI